MSQLSKEMDENNRIYWNCPKCKKGENSKDFGGNKNCFHCDTCEYVECEND